MLQALPLGGLGLSLESLLHTLPLDSSLLSVRVYSGRLQPNRKD